MSHPGLGNSVAVDAGLALLGAPFEDTSIPGAGIAHVYDLATGQVLYELTASNAAQNDHFGSGVALGGGRALVGAADSGFHDGSAYVYDLASGNELFVLTPSDGDSQAELGSAVAIDGDRELVAGRLHSHGESSSTGGVWVFDLATGQELYELNAPGTPSSVWFGSSLAADAGTVVVGAPFFTGQGHGVPRLRQHQQLHRRDRRSVAVKSEVGGSTAPLQFPMSICRRPYQSSSEARTK